MAKLMVPEYEALFKLIANALFGANATIDLESVDFEKLYSEAKHQTVLGITFDVLPDSARDYNKAIYDEWQCRTFHVLKNNVTQMYANAELEKIFSDAKIDICTIKGFASAYYYPNKNLRQMGDIDFIVPINDIPKCKELLKANEFVCIDEDELHSYHIGYKKGKTHYEMHKNVTELLDEEGKITSLVSTIFDNSVKLPFDNFTLTAPNPVLHGIIMLLHMQKHMITGGGIGLRHLCDWAVFVNNFDTNEWTEKFEPILKELGLWTFAKAMSKVANLYLKMPQKNWFEDIDEDLAEDLLCDIMLGGNFGYKDTGRYQELIFINQHKEGAFSNTSILRKLPKKVREWHPVFRKSKIAFFFGLFLYPVRIAFLLLLGKRNNVFVEKRESGTQRNALYDKIFKKQ